MLIFYGGAEFDADYDHLQCDEELSYVLNALRQPGVKIAAFFCWVEEKSMQWRSKPQGEANPMDVSSYSYAHLDTNLAHTAPTNGGLMKCLMARVRRCRGDGSF